MSTAFTAANIKLLRVGEGEQQRIAAAWAGMGYDSEPGSGRGPGSIAKEGRGARRTLAIRLERNDLVITNAWIWASNDMPTILSIRYPQLGYEHKDTS